MKNTEILLNAGRLGDSPSILVLFDHNRLIGDWLSQLSYSFRTCNTESELIELQLTGTSWDLVIAGEGLQRFYSVTTPQRLLDFFMWLHGMCRLCIVPPERVALDPSSPNIERFRIPFQASPFTYISEDTSNSVFGTSPAIHLSHEFLFDGHAWFQSSELSHFTPFSSIDIAMKEALDRPRTFLAQGELIIKTQVGAVAFLESLEVGREIQVLNDRNAPQFQDLKLPKVLRSSFGSCITSLTREFIPGESMQVGTLTDSLDGIFELAKRYASKGLFHNDFRPWNIVQSGENFSLIDFADISGADLDSRNLPQVVALVGTLAALGQIDTYGMPLRWGEEFDKDLIAITHVYCSENDVRFPYLYGEPWLCLAEQATPSRLNSATSISEIFDVVLAL